MTRRSLLARLRDTRVLRHPWAGAVLAWTGARAAQIGLFLAVFAGCAVALHAVSMSNVLWHLMQDRFRADPDHQVHSLFLPLRPREIPLVIVGDAHFHAAVPDRLAGAPGVERLVINHYEVTDLEHFLDASIRAEDRIATRVCNVLAQAMPVFMVRAKAIGEPQNLDMLRIQSKLEWFSIDRGVKAFFAAIDRWTGLLPTGDPATRPHGRIAALVGQARGADPGRENWALMLRHLPDFGGRLILVNDPRETDLGPGSALPAALEAAVSEAGAALGDTIEMVGLDGLDTLAVPGCAPG